MSMPIELDPNRLSQRGVSELWKRGFSSDLGRIVRGETLRDKDVFAMERVTPFQMHARPETGDSGGGAVAPPGPPAPPEVIPVPPGTIDQGLTIFFQTTNFADMPLTPLPQNLEMKFVIQGITGSITTLMLKTELDGGKWVAYATVQASGGSNLVLLVGHWDPSTNAWTSPLTKSSNGWSMGYPAGTTIVENTFENSTDPWIQWVYKLIVVIRG